VRYGEEQSEGGEKYNVNDIIVQEENSSYYLPMHTPDGYSYVIPCPMWGYDYNLIWNF